MSEDKDAESFAMDRGAQGLQVECFKTPFLHKQSNILSSKVGSRRPPVRRKTTSKKFFSKACNLLVEPGTKVHV